MILYTLHNEIWLVVPPSVLAMQTNSSRARSLAQARGPDSAGYTIMFHNWPAWQNINVSMH